MTIEEAIKNRERCLEYLEGCGPQASAENVEAVRLSLAALRAQQEAEKNDPLTVEEVREMKNTPVFVVPLERVPKDEWSEWCVMNYAGNIAHIPGVEYMWWDVDNYGKEWLAYRRQPSKEG